ncbi:MAG: hypothetical protein HYS05_00830 [Acidobacteria bacterium]|nr:hypothetical protein [Acidobacteriota bacterium]
MRPTATFGLLGAALMMLVVSLVALGAHPSTCVACSEFVEGQQQGGAGAQQGGAAAPPAQPPSAPPAPPAAPAPKPLVPVAANTVAANPDAYYGQPVTVTAVVERILSRSAFVVAQRTYGGATNTAVRKDLLVLVPTITGAVDQNAYVTVFGEVVRFDPAEVAKKAKDYKIDLAPEVVAEYTGRPAVVATSVLNAAMTDLAKRLPPPMNSQEEAYSKVMKRVGPAFAELRKGIEASTVDVTSKNATVLRQAFAETETFWKTRKRDDAIKWAQDARRQVETIEKAVAGAKWDDVKTAAGTLGQACQTCHTAYRERFDDGSFRIKMPSK